VSDYQPRPQGGWPSQPPAGNGGQWGNAPQPGYSGQAGSQGQRGYEQTGYGPSGPNSYDQAPYGQPAYDQAAYGQQQAAPPPRRRRRRRPLVWLAVVLVVLLAIVGIGDQVAKAYAQGDMAKQIQSAGLSAKPTVNIEGWPFLTQILSHDLKTVDISANNVTTTGAKIPFSFAAKATGVHLNSSFSGATIDHIAGQVSVTYQSLDSGLGNTIGIPGLSAIKFSPDPKDGPNAVTADAGIASVTATAVKTGSNQITIKFGSLGGFASVLGGGGSIPDQVVNLPKLPAGLVLGSPTATDQGIVIPATASNTTLSQ
jgi:hypothetical protein